MASLDLKDTVKTLRVERIEVSRQLAKLDRAIAVLQELAGKEPTPNGRVGKRTMSASVRRKIAKAQKQRWAKVRAKQKAKA